MCVCVCEREATQSSSAEGTLVVRKLFLCIFVLLLISGPLFLISFDYTSYQVSLFRYVCHIFMICNETEFAIIKVC
jgi:hypothetical protein